MLKDKGEEYTAQKVFLLKNYFPGGFSLVASLVAQLVKNPLAMQETLVRYLGREDPLEKG